jgi:hypothetical protein
VLTEHPFNLASLSAAHGGTTDAGELSNALAARITQTVGLEALGRALLKLEVGSADLEDVGPDVAQTVARRLNHQIVLDRGPGKLPLNICP